MRKLEGKMVDNTLSKLKDDFAKQELEKDKLLVDIQIKYWWRLKLKELNLNLSLTKLERLNLDLNKCIWTKWIL